MPTKTTSLEIFRNPGDLHIELAITHPKKEILVHLSRGPSPGYRSLIDWNTGHQDRCAALAELRVELMRISALGYLVQEEVDAVSSVLSPDASVPNGSTVLDELLIERIIEHLQEHDACATNQWQFAA